MDGSTRLIVSLLDIGEQTLNFLVPSCRGYVCQICRIDVLNVGQLSNRLVYDAFLVVSGLGDPVRALTVLDLLLGVVLLCARRARAWYPGSIRCLFLEIESGCCCIFLRLRCDYPTRSTCFRQMPLV